MRFTLYTFLTWAMVAIVFSKSVDKDPMEKATDQICAFIILGAAGIMETILDVNKKDKT